MNERLSQRFSPLYQENIFHTLLGWFNVGGSSFMKEEKGALAYSPLSMFFYNLRTLFFISSLLFLVAFSIPTIFLPSTPQMRLTILTLFIFWLLDALITSYLNKRTRVKIHRWISAPKVGAPPSILDIYFIVDFTLVLGLILTGKLLSVNLDAFSFLLFASTVIWSAYIGGGRHSNRIFFLALALVPLVSFLLFLGTRITITGVDWFDIVLFLGPLTAMSLVTVFSVLMISMLRATEHQVTREQLQVLGKYENLLSPTSVKPKVGQGINQELFSERQFDKQAAKVLKDLCSLGFPFWYGKACLWFIEEHQDRGTLAIPGPRYNLPEADKYKDGIEPHRVFINFSELLLLQPFRSSAENVEDTDVEFRPTPNTPTAIVPLKRDGKNKAVLALYGSKTGLMISREEEAFLRSLGAIFSNAMDQWAARYRTFPQREMNDLFKRRALDEVFPLAASILKRYLMAAGCMVVFRRDPNSDTMDIVAKDGFSNDIYNSHYVVGRGQTGVCAQQGVLIRWDDVEQHKEEFDITHLKYLAKSHGKSIISWMTIPIGPREKNYGVIKVVNSEFRSNWFTEYDERLGEDLALRLQVIIEKFLQIKETEEASTESKRQAAIAEKNAKDALDAKRRAEESARQRQQDLLTITHQLQAPLIPVIGTLSGFSRGAFSKQIKDKLDHIQALVEDAFILCYGTFTTFAVEVDQRPAYVTENINAPAELRELCERLRRTNARSDISFVFREAADFPVLRMDRNIFTSVLYSLVHNAMKYADESSEVTLECGFEGPPRRAVLKVKSHGERIHPSEREEIFRKFGRGREIEKGRHHRGVGLGLWVARELMQYVGGDLKVELSPYDPSLSVFIVYVPDG